MSFFSSFHAFGVILTPELQKELSALLDQGAGNSRVAGYLQEYFSVYNAETMNLFDGTPADYFTDANGLQIEFSLLDDSLVKIHYSWEDAAPIVRALHGRDRQQEQASPEQGEQPQPDYDYNTIPPLTLDAPPERAAERAAPTAGNFRITDDRLGEGGQKTKYGYNVAAIRTLKQIEAENRHATWDEQEVLSKYVGWGGIPQAFDENNAKWTQEYAELEGLLTTEEYEAARRSTLNAHYTAPTVIKAMYETLGRLGFEKGVSRK